MDGIEIVNYEKCKTAKLLKFKVTSEAYRKKFLVDSKAATCNLHGDDNPDRLPLQMGKRIERGHHRSVV